MNSTIFALPDAERFAGSGFLERIRGAVHPGAAVAPLGASIPETALPVAQLNKIFDQTWSRALRDPVAGAVFAEQASDWDALRNRYLERWRGAKAQAKGVALCEALYEVVDTPAGDREHYVFGRNVALFDGKSERASSEAMRFVVTISQISIETLCTLLVAAGAKPTGRDVIARSLAQLASREVEVLLKDAAKIVSSLIRTSGRAGAAGLFSLLWERIDTWAVLADLADLTHRPEHALNVADAHFRAAVMARSINSDYWPGALPPEWQDVAQRRIAAAYVNWRQS
jgi:hypothetical protein